MGFGNLFVFGAHVFDIGGLHLGAEQARNDADGAAGVGDVDGLALVVTRVDLDRRVDAAGGRAADQQRNIETLALHLCGHVDHFIERRRDQPERPMILTFSALAVSRIFAAGTMTPRSMIS